VNRFNLITNLRGAGEIIVTEETTE
jgi:hypothetical protein